MAFTVGDLIDGHYRVERRYAGGMGYVYIVLDEIVGKRFAIKQLPALQAESKVLQERFRREAAAWLLLDHHAHIVQAHSFHPRPEGPILILEFVDGPSLDQLLKEEKRLSPVQVVLYARQFCQAMTYAHSKPIADRGIGLLHRDIKPGNILITSGNCLKVTDFGLAKLEGDSRITGEGQFVGTVAYSSPEQVRSASQVTKASDVYSFGAVMYQMLAGRPMFLARSASELFKLILDTPPLPIEELCPDIDRGLAGILYRCIEKDTAARFSDFAQLEKALAGLEILLRDRRDWSCKKCGFVSRSRATECPICASPVDTAASSMPVIAGWSCSCGARVPHTEKVCPKCGRSRAVARAATANDDQPLPVPADLVPIQIGSDTGTGGDSAAAKKDQKPGETLWPQRPDALPPSPGDSNIAPAAVSDRPQAAAAKQLWDPTGALASLIELGSRDRLMAWPLERSSYTVGRDAQMRIRLKDPAVAGNQLFIVRLPCGWLAINRQPGTRVQVNGWRADQRLLRPGDILHFGATWLAFDGPMPSTEPITPLAGNWRRIMGMNTQTVEGGGSATQVQSTQPVVCSLELPDGSEVQTSGEPLRLGTTRLCNVCLDDPTVAPMHALLAWQNDGLHLFDLTGSGVSLAEGRAAAEHRLRHRDAFCLGSTTIHLRIEGDASAPARERASREAAELRMALTVAVGPQKGQYAVLPIGQSLVLGRHSDCDLAIPADPYMSRRHLQFTASSGQIEVKDLGSRHGFAIGAKSYAVPQTAVARPGDVIKVGQHYLLVHHEITL